MTFELGTLFIAGVAYLLLLFLIAYAAERGIIPSKVVRHPATYVLSLGVYATTWSFYGSVGFAQRRPVQADVVPERVADDLEAVRQ